MSIACANCGKSLDAQQANEPCPDCGSHERNIITVERGVAAEKVQALQELARRHYLVEPGLTHVFRLVGAPDREMSSSEPIKLLEVNEDTPPAGVMPLHFGPTPAIGVHFPSIIIEVTPDEYDQIRTSKLKLPDGWQIAEELPKPNGTGGD